jgi:hypothetical protein
LWISGGDNFGFNTGGSDIYGISNASSKLANKWVHVAAIFPNNYPSYEPSLYINGEKQSLSLLSGARNTISATPTILISGWGTNLDYKFNGTIDEVKIWNRALTDAEIKSEYGSVIQTCSDGTQYSQCSSTKPKYCSNGTLINKCTQCGCSAGTCQSNGTCTLSSFGTPINKALAAYDYFSSRSSADRAFAGNHFSLLDIYLDDTASALQEIKNANPNVKILGYTDLIGSKVGWQNWDVVNAHEDWFVHDANGNRIQNNQWKYYLMDVSSSGWRQNWVDYVNSKFSINPNYDGVFVDDVYNSLSSADFSSTIPSAVLSNWKTNCMGMLTYIKPKIPTGKLLFINTNEMLTDDYLNLPAVDGSMIEGYVHADWTPATTYGDEMTWINILARKSATNKMVWAASGTTYDATQMAKMVKYSYASFLLGMNGSRTYWSFNTWWSGDGSKGYYSLMDTNIGQPAGAYYSSQNVYMRDFTGGKVLFNPSTSSYAVSLGGSYKNLDGTQVTSITMNPHTGEILLKI